MSPTPRSYRAVVRLGVGLAPVLGLADPKVAEGHRRRVGAATRLGEWAAESRERAGPLAWFHAASVGEGRQAESVLLELKRLRPDCQLVYTHFSPSAEPLARRLPVDAADYLPYDRPVEMDRLLQSLAPALLVFAKLDLWPELATRASSRGVAVAMVAATVSPGSGRLRWPARALLRSGYRAVTAAAAISDADAARLATLGVAADRIRVLGDPRFDSVADRVAAVGHDDPLLRLATEGAPLVAGSTWPADEAVLLPAFARVRSRHPEARLIIAPHEPTPDHLDQLERRAAAAGLPSPARLSTARGDEALLVVDRVGVLATVYGAGVAAYVGGGFGRAGLHSVLEPAAWGLPVVFGPRWGESRDAALLLVAGAGAALPPGRGAEDALLREWTGWLDDGTEGRRRGGLARALVAAGRGAARRSAELLAGLIS
jgi:3-deoxy-D-manno-octulosonic-acid transferase